MRLNRAEFLLLHRKQSVLVESLSVVTKQLEATVKGLGLDPEDCDNLSFPQLGETHSREPTVKGILTDDCKTFYRYIWVMDFVARSLRTPLRKMDELRTGLHDLTDAINYLFRKHGIDHVERPADPEDIEESMDEEIRFWLEGESNTHCVHPVRNYVIAKLLGGCLDAFGRDVRELTEESRITHMESAVLTCYDEESVCCVTVTEMESVLHRQL